MPTDNPLSFWDHLDLLRRTLLLCLAVVAGGATVGLLFHQQLLHLFLRPLSTIGGEGTQVVLLGPMEGLAAVLKIAVWIGLAGTGPIWGFLLYTFVAPALGERERRGAVAFFIASLMALVAGSSMAYTLSLPMATELLHTFNARLGLNLWSLSHYLNYAALFVLGHAIAFQLMVLLLFTIHYRAIGPGILTAKRPHAIIAILILAAILTPPDILSQCLLAIPLLIFYEGAIIYAKIRGSKRAKGY